MCSDGAFFASIGLESKQMLRHSKKSIEKLNFFLMLPLEENKVRAGTINSVVILRNCYSKVVSYSEIGCVFFLDLCFSSNSRSGMDTSPLGGLDLSEHTPSLLGSTTMAAGLANVGNTFGGPPSSLVSRPNKFQNLPIEDDDDVVFIEPIQPPQNSTSLVGDQRNTAFTSSKNEELKGNDCKMLPSPKDLNSRKGSISETIIIDDEEDIETNQGQEKNASSFNDRRLPECKNRTNEMEFSPSSFSRSKVNSGIGNSGITTEPDSEIQIANVTTLERGAMSSVSCGHLENDADGRDMNLMITHVTSLQNASSGDVSNGLQADNFGVNLQTYTPSLTSQTKTGVGPFNPGRMNAAGDVFQNGESVTHHNPGKLQF